MADMVSRGASSPDQPPLFATKAELMAWVRQCLRWKRPRTIFVCAHGDLFHENVPDEWIDRVFAVMALAPQHTFQVLTKRAKRMREYLSDCDWFCGPRERGRVASNAAYLAKQLGLRIAAPEAKWPLPNVWLAVLVEPAALSPSVNVEAVCPSATPADAAVRAALAARGGKIVWEGE